MVSVTLPVEVDGVEGVVVSMPTLVGVDGVPADVISVPLPVGGVVSLQKLNICCISSQTGKRRTLDMQKS